MDNCQLLLSRLKSIQTNLPTHGLMIALMKLAPNLTSIECGFGGNDIKEVEALGMMKSLTRLTLILNDDGLLPALKEVSHALRELTIVSRDPRGLFDSIRNLPQLTSLIITTRHSPPSPPAIWFESFHKIGLTQQQSIEFVNSLVEMETIH
jgi:hypothetical protein